LYYLIEGYRAAVFGTEWYFITHWEYTLYFWGLVIVLFLLGSAMHVKCRRHFIEYLSRLVVYMEKAIIAKNITKKYKLYKGTKERILDLISPKSYGEDFYALANVSFEAEKGDVIGFLGINGSGKSTLSNIIAGIVPQTSGTVEVNG